MRNQNRIFVPALAGFFVFFLSFLSFDTPAMAVADMAVTVTPAQIQAEINRAEPQKAIADLAPILKNDPHSAKAWYLDAEALDASGNTACARNALEKAEHLSPDMPFANQKDLHKLEKRVGIQKLRAFFLPQLASRWWVAHIFCGACADDLGTLRAIS